MESFSFMTVVIMRGNGKMTKWKGMDSYIMLVEH